jgi:hypothetical protein
MLGLNKTPEGSSVISCFTQSQYFSMMKDAVSSEYQSLGCLAKICVDTFMYMKDHNLEINYSS